MSGEVVHNKHKEFLKELADLLEKHNAEILSECDTYGDTYMSLISDGGSSDTEYCVIDSVVAKRLYEN